MSSVGAISHEEVLRHVFDFLAFHGYRDTLAALQAESGVAYNVVHVSLAPEAESAARLKSHRGGQRGAYPPPTEEGLERAVMDGSWAEVLHVYTDGLLLPEDVRANLYETIFEELLAVHGLHPAAKALFYNAPAFAVMRQSAPARFARLERLLQDFDLVAWEEQKRKRAGAVSADTLKRRGDVCKSLQGAIQFRTEPYLGKLAAALCIATHGAVAGGDEGGPSPAAKRRRTGATVPDGPKTMPQPACSTAAAAAAVLGYPLAAPRTVSRAFECGEGNRSVACCVLLPETQHASSVALVGRADGVVDCVDARSGTAVGPPMTHTQGVLTICLDESVAASGGVCWAAVGYRDGWVKVYNTETHKLVRRFAQAHSMGVTCVMFAGHQHTDELAGHHQLLVTGSYDATIKLLSLAAGSVLTTIHETHHGAFVNALCPLPSSSVGSGAHFTGAAMSAGNDGTLAFWRVHPDAEALAQAAAAAAAAAAQSEGTHRPLTSLLTRIGGNMNVRALHADCRDAVATALVLLAPAAAATPAAAAAGGAEPLTPEQSVVTAEVLVVTRSAVALVLSVSLDTSATAGSTTAQPVRPTLLCLLRAHRPLRHVACVPASVTSGSSAGAAVPMLSLNATTEEGTIALYNVEMSWRDEQRLASFGGAVVVAGPTDESPVIITEAGHPVQDVRVCPLPLRMHEAPAVLASAESLPSFYLLT